jgi:hypothetical protein
MCDPAVFISGGSADLICTTKIKAGNPLVDEIGVWLGSGAWSELKAATRR